MLRTISGKDEAAENGGRTRGEHHHLWREPSECASTVKHEQKADDAERQRRRARQIEVRFMLVVGALAQKRYREEHRPQRDRHAEQEYAAPTEAVDQRAADYRSAWLAGESNHIHNPNRAPTWAGRAC